MVKGNTRGDINVRTSPVVTDPITNLSFVSRGKVGFVGEIITSAIDGKSWIKLSEINGIPVVGAFIASWIVDIADRNYVPPITTPVVVHEIEVYSDGSLVIDGILYK